MFLAIEQISIPEALLMSLLGMSVVFVALVGLMACIKIQSFVVARLAARKTAIDNAASMTPAPSQSPVPAAAEIAARVGPAPGSMGDCALHGVDPKTAALLMAVVADELKAPLNELRFVSIREI